RGRVRPVVVQETERGDLRGADAELLGDGLPVSIPAEGQPLQRKRGASNCRTILAHDSRAPRPPAVNYLDHHASCGEEAVSSAAAACYPGIGRITLQGGKIGLTHIGRTARLPSCRVAKWSTSLDNPDTRLLRSLAQEAAQRGRAASMCI